MRPPLTRQTMRRSVPTPGSTTARNTVPRGIQEEEAWRKNPALLQTERRHVMADVDELAPGGSGQDGPLDLPDEWVLEPEIRKQRDYLIHNGFMLLLSVPVHKKRTVAPADAALISTFFLLPHKTVWIGRISGRRTLFQGEEAMPSKGTKEGLAALLENERTARRTAEEALAASRQELLDLLDSLPFPLFLQASRPLHPLRQPVLPGPVRPGPGASLPSDPARPGLSLSAVSDGQASGGRRAAGRGVGRP